MTLFLLYMIHMKNRTRKTVYLPRDSVQNPSQFFASWLKPRGCLIVPNTRVHQHLSKLSLSICAHQLLSPCQITWLCQALLSREHGLRGAREMRSHPLVVFLGTLTALILPPLLWHLFTPACPALHHGQAGQLAFSRASVKRGMKTSPEGGFAMGGVELHEPFRVQYTDEQPFWPVSPRPSAAFLGKSHWLI